MIKENRGQSLADGQGAWAEAENKTEEQMECHLNEEQTEAVVSTEGLIRDRRGRFRKDKGADRAVCLSCQ